MDEPREFRFGFGSVFRLVFQVCVSLFLIGIPVALVTCGIYAALFYGASQLAGVTFLAFALAGVIAFFSWISRG